MKVLGVDPGFAKLGFALVELRGSLRYVLTAGIATTKRSDDRTHSEDSVARGRELTWALRHLFGKGQIDVICLEAMQGMGGMGKPCPVCRQTPAKRGSISTAKSGMSYGLIAAMSALYNVPVVQASPQTARARLGLAPKSDEGTIARAVIRQFTFVDGSIASVTFCGTPLSYEERLCTPSMSHIVDALAVVIGCEGKLSAMRQEELISSQVPDNRGGSRP